MTDEEAGRALRELQFNALRIGFLSRFSKWLGVKPSQLANVEQGRHENDLKAENAVFDEQEEPRPECKSVPGVDERDQT